MHVGIKGERECRYGFVSAKQVLRTCLGRILREIDALLPARRMLYHDLSQKQVIFCSLCKLKKNLGKTINLELPISFFMSLKVTFWLVMLKNKCTLSQAFVWTIQLEEFKRPKEVKLSNISPEKKLQKNNTVTN